MDPSLYHAFYEVEDRHWWFQGRRTLIATVLPEAMEGLPAPRRLLDVGCGTGGMLPVLAPHGTVTGIDSEPLALGYCRQRGFTDVHLQEGYEPAAPFDVLTLFDVLEHVPDERVFLSRLYGWLRPGGRILVTVPAFQWLWSRHDDLNHHQRRYTRARLRLALESAGFVVRRTSYFNTLLFPLVVCTRALERLRPAGPGDAREVLGHLKIGALNAPLSALFGAERLWLRRGDFPFGVSALALGAKPDAVTG